MNKGFEVIEGVLAVRFEAIRSPTWSCIPNLPYMRWLNTMTAA